MSFPQNRDRTPRILVATFAFFLALACRASADPPSNDDCANAIPITLDDQTFTGTTVEATPDGGNTCGQVSIAPSVWYTFIRNRPGTLHLGTCPSALDTAVSVHLTCPGGPATEIACAHDSCPQLCGAQNATCLTLATSANLQYAIRIAGYTNQTGTFTLHALFEPSGPPANDACDRAIDLPFENGTITGSIGGATRDGASACDQSVTDTDVWYRYSAFRSGRVEISTCPSYFDVVLSVRDGCPGNITHELVCAADCFGGALCGPLFNTCVSLDVAAGRTYWIRVAGHSAYSEQFSLRLTLYPTPTGDFTGDGHADGDDIQPFVRAVQRSSTSAADLAAGDFNANGHIDSGDTPGMVGALLR